MSNADVDNTEILISASFPLPFRVVALVGLGILAWATNIHGLLCFNIDVVSAMDLRIDGYPLKALNPLPAHRWNGHGQHKTTPQKIFYSISFVYFIWFLATWLIYVSATGGNPKIADAFGYIAAVAILVILIVLICPFPLLFKRERDKLLRTMWRCLFSPMTAPVYFADIIFADIFTSFAKVLSDFWLSFCMLLPGNSIMTPPPGSGWKRWILPTVMSLPYFIRLRQCIIEYSLPSNKSRRPLFNALKYATSFPVIYLSAAQRVVLLDLASEKGEQVLNHAWHGEHRLFRFWLLSAVINSLYSFWWDVTYDWGLNLFKIQDRESSARPAPLRPLILPHRNFGTPLLTRRRSQDSKDVDLAPHGVVTHRHQETYFWQLRPILLYPAVIYPLLVFVNFVLRMTWSIKLSSHLHLKTDGSYAIFFVEVAEIVRRWMWVFIRVEWEVIKKAHEESPKAVSENSEENPYEMYSLTRDELDVAI
ncbi:hypothetical protein AX17_004019 [Amanita inopinata Kibby_2008]|nr:hypothetical protein AX17_004019 [Amanita inopinata Kibby_2008]